jgi:hypothetical protein
MKPSVVFIVIQIRTCCRMRASGDSEFGSELLVAVPGCVFVNNFLDRCHHHVFQKATGEFSDDQSDSKEYGSDFHGQNQYCLKFRTVQYASKCNGRKRD